MIISLTSLVFAGVVAVLIYKLLTRYLRYKQWAAQYDVIPGTEGHWFWGHMKENPGTCQEGFDYLMSFVKPFPKLHKMWFSRLQCAIIMHHPDTIKYIMKCPATVAPKPRETGTFYKMGLPWLGEGLLLTNGETWARDRRLLTPGFHFDVLQPYVPVFNQTVDILMGKLENFANSGEVFDMYHNVGLLALDNMMRCALSSQTDCQLRENHPYVTAVKRLSDLWCDRSMHVIQFFDWIYFNFTRNGKEFLQLCDYVHEVSFDIIRSRRQELENDINRKEGLETKKRYKDFLDILLTARYEDGQSLTDLEIRNEVDTFLFEGHDTTASGISYILMALSQHPAIQQRAQAEIDQLLEGRQSQYIEWKDLPQLQYLTLCIKEGLRMNPPVFYTQRAMEKEMIVDGFKIPKGAAVIFNIHNLHHNPTVWGEDHWEFKPDRFLPENTEKRDPFAFSPFSGGQRNCIGQHFAMNEMKVTIARILHRYTLQIDPDFKQRNIMSVVMRPESGIPMTVVKRQ